MRFKNTLLAVTDMEKSVAFYRKVLGLRKIMDFGANVTLTGGICLQTCETWAEFIGISPHVLGWCGKIGELYFEEDGFDASVFGISYCSSQIPTVCVLAYLHEQTDRCGGILHPLF